MTKKKKQVLLLQEDDSGIRSTYKTQSRPTYHRLRPGAQVEKKYKQSLLCKIPAKKKKKNLKKRKESKQYKQQKIEECRRIVLQNEFSLRGRGEHDV